jgi:polyhydroxybutyrate depolymerase
MQLKKILFVSLIISSCGGGGGSSAENLQTNSATPAPAPAPSSSSTAITSDLIAQAKGTIAGKISYNDIDREFILYVPSSYDSSAKQALVFNFHGYGSDADEQMNYGDLRPQADANGFILVHPDALDDIGGTSYWNMGGWSISAHDDLKFIENLINLLMDKYSVDSERIYSTGMSNGGFFSFHLACNMNASFAAIASVTGSMSYETYESCNARKPTPVMQIHGSNDITVPYSGIDLIMKPIMNVMEYWKINNACDDFIHTVPDITSEMASWTETYLFDNCANETQNIHLYIQGARHIWPGSRFESISDPNASSTIWEFFSRYDINGLREEFILQSINIDDSNVISENPIQDSSDTPSEPSTPDTTQENNDAFAEDIALEPLPLNISSNLIMQTKGLISGEISYENINRKFILYVPSSYNSNKKQPLVINFHGYTSSANEHLNYGDLRAQADESGFVLVYPDALNDIQGKSYWNMGGWSESNNDDLEFVKNLISLLRSKYSINSDRIYATGHSNGGFFSFHLGCNLSSTFAAVASITGSMSLETFNECSPKKPLPILQMHGSEDTVVPYSGTKVLGVENSMKPIMDVMEYWRVNNKCDNYILMENQVYEESSVTTNTYEYQNCLNNVKNIHILVNGAGHVWPGAISTNIKEPNASVTIWEFFSKYDINGVIQ